MWKRTLLYLFVLSIVRSQTEVRNSKIVHVAQGPVKGYQDLETGVYSFQSIPYATAPTGSNRFKAPLPPPVWMHPLEAIDKGIVCPQKHLHWMKDTLNIQEDCLIANVYVPDTNDKNLPVVVYVHGLIYQLGYGDMLAPKNLAMENNIIGITVNFRLGTHGFLCLGTDDIPGNAGMKDLVAALRWVKKNVASFGGNPDEITIAGYGSGSAAVDLLMLSNSTEGLFNKIISESGAGVSTWSIQSDPIEMAKRYAKFMKFTDVDDISALENFYKTVPYDILNSVQYIFKTDFTFGLSPCIERQTSEEVFLDKSPVDILKSGKYNKVPILNGFANMEGRILAMYFNPWKNGMNQNFSNFIPNDLNFRSMKQKEEVAKEIKQFYFGADEITRENILDFVDYISDATFVFPIMRTVKYHIEAGHNQIYLYEYSFVENSTRFPLHRNITNGATHCAEIGAVFNGLRMLPKFADPSKYTKDFLHHGIVMRKIWGNFIKTGKPIPEGSELPAWPPVRAGWSPHMSLGNEISLRGALLEQRMRFWDDIYEQYYRDPLAPQPIKDIEFSNIETKNCINCIESE